MPESENTAPESTNNAAAHRKSRKWIIVTVVVVALLVAIAIQGYRAVGGNDEKASTSAEPRIKSVLHLETFVINLDDPGQKSYLRIGIDLGLTGPPHTKEGEGGIPTAQLRDTILNVLSVGHPEELLTPAGKAKLKADLLHALRQRAPEMGIEEVYFTEFLIQR